MQRIDAYPTHVINGLKCRPGRVLPFGASFIGGGGVNFSVYSKNATGCSLILFHNGAKAPFAQIPLSDEFRIGDVYTITVYDLNIENLEYGYRFEGPYDTKKGLIFDSSKIVLDPYAKLISGRNRWGIKKDAVENEFIHRGCVIFEDFDWEGDKPLELPLEDLVIYEAHVRGYTADDSSSVKRRGTFAGLTEKIPYLKKMGINCIELLPIFEFDEFEFSREHDGERLLNYWGYSTVGFFAPKSGYAASAPLGLAADELKNMIKKLHSAGIEIILDVVFNHTAEGNERGPVISFKGIDNPTYYMLTEDGYYKNYSGCGNTMNCNNAVVRGMIMDCLRYWVTDYHIDGFRFDLASILSRDENGNPMPTPPVLESLAGDPVLGKTKLIAEAWDAGGMYQVGSFPSFGRWAEWNGKYRDAVRRFLKSDASAGPELIRRIQGSPDLYMGRGSSASINFVTCHDGFTLYDLFSYNEKHNLANGEKGGDGTNDNYSWNCGVEGETKDKEINALRLRLAKNAIALLLLSRGVPMLLAGDEFLNTQFGNNNSYCHDNKVSWLDWNGLKDHPDMVSFVTRMIDFRKKHPVITSPHHYTGYNSSGYPELSFHGTSPWNIDINAPLLSFGFMYAQTKAEHGRDEFIYCAVNSYWEEKEFELPILPEGFEWKKKEYTGKKAVKTGDKILLEARSLMILVGR